MTVSDLIRELTALPQGLRVRVVTASVTVLSEDGDHNIRLSDDDATEVDDVRSMGPFVLIRGR